MNKTDTIYNAPKVENESLSDSEYLKAESLNFLSRAFLNLVEGNDRDIEFSIFYYYQGFSLIPKRKQELCSPILYSIKSLISDLGLIPGSDHFYKLEDIIKETMQWGSVINKDKEVDIDQLKSTYIINNPTTKISKKRESLVKFLFDQYDKDIFNEFVLAELLESVQKTCKCSCGRIVFSFPSDNGVCEICSRINYHEYSIYIGEIKDKQEAINLCMELNI